MLEISHLKVESPSCLWGRVVQGPGGGAETTEEYERLLDRINLFYRDAAFGPKPRQLQEGQMCVVYWGVRGMWCRALVEAVFVDSTTRLARCFLVDYAERLVVASDQTRPAQQDFLRLPFWMRSFHLAGIRPTTLQVSVCQDKAELIGSRHWDSSATLYLHRLLQASTRTTAVLLDSDGHSTATLLYLVVGGIKICVNDDLVAKRFAYYTGELLDSALDQEVRSPVMLSGAVFDPNTHEGFLWRPVQDPSPQAQKMHRQKFSMESSRSPGSSPQGQPELKTSEEAGGSEVMEPQRAVDVDADSKLLKFLDSRGSVQENLPVGLAVSVHRLGYTETLARRQCFRQVGQQEEMKARPPGRPADASTQQEMCEALVHSGDLLEPCDGLDDAPLTDALRQVLRAGPPPCPLTPAERHSWPAVARGRNALVVSPGAERPLGYLPPLLTRILLHTVPSAPDSRSGPVAVLLCPGWEKVRVVYDLLEEIEVSNVLRPFTALLGHDKCETKNLRIPRKCLLLVTTPFSLVRLLSHHCFQFLRLCHLVLDEADRLFAQAPEQMATILQHFQKVTSGKEKGSCPQQLVAVAKRWTPPMEDLLANHMLCPFIVITTPGEAALYGDVQQTVLLTPEGGKMAAVLAALDFRPAVREKIVIVGGTVEEVEDIFKVMSDRTALCLKAQQGVPEQFGAVLRQWERDARPGTHLVLVTTDQTLPCLDIRDATAIVHFGFPPSARLFGSRLLCLSKNFRDLSQQAPRNPTIARSLLLVSERNARLVPRLLHYLRRTSSPLPPELLVLARLVQAAAEDAKTGSLCGRLKSLGTCRDDSVCPDRHRIVPHLDHSDLPASGVLEVVPLYVKTATLFYGRLVGKDRSAFDRMASEMVSYYVDKMPRALEPLEGGLYAIQEDQTFHRVKVLSSPDRAGRLLVLLLDVGKEEEVMADQVLSLPDQFRHLPAQAVEMVLCGLRPADGENSWHPKVTRAVRQKIRGLRHRARVVLTAGNTVFFDSMILVAEVPGTGVLINKHSVPALVLSTGMGEANSQHVGLLKALQQDAKTAHPSSPQQAPPGGRIQAEDQLLAQTVRAAAGQRREEKVPSDSRPEDVEKNVQASGLRDGEPHFCSSDVPDEAPEDHLIGPESFSFHPQVRWYQSTRALTVRLVLTGPEDQSCHFYSDRVVYSGRVKGRLYRLDLELQQSIAAETSSWAMKSEQPVLTLVKQREGLWDRLTRSKNMFVRFDTDYLEDDEDGEDQGVCFVENTGEEDHYVHSDSGSESD